MNFNKLYLIANNDKKFAAWCKEKRKKLTGELQTEFFNNHVQDIRYGNYFARATFICYWEIQLSTSLTRLAPAVTQATLISIREKLIIQDKMEDAEVVSLMMTNFLRLLQRLDDEEQRLDDEEE